MIVPRDVSIPSSIWTRNTRVSACAFVHHSIDLPCCTGQSSADKVAKVREEMQKKKAKAVVVTMLDEVAWLFNLRGSDIDYNPGE